MNKGQTSAAAEPSELTHLLGDADPAAFGTMRAELMDARSRLAHSELATDAMKIRIQSLVAALRCGVEALREYTDTCEALDAMELELSCFDDVTPNTPLQPRAATAVEPVVGHYWLIEYFPCAEEPNKKPLWWNGTHWNAQEDSAWTDDANNAIKFVSHIQASVVCMGLMAYNCREVRKIGAHYHRSVYGDFRPTEHLWPNTQVNAPCGRKEAE